ncbi:PEP-CTERM sorting domain-containing protein [Rugamonas apoptosis]|uniref:PEP-CTERM sorting domain-containing protein n=1 Tax=Rugamonas apoptosis TaxID=2758570 RepID=A0A7W2IKV5_9BURK|nr:PEP-CTERM sorting domain-containing protein [Rugamonas apoptosis]MBA5687963.1 PEP-CTERM sorting domain-containing protein [Rugamonas apoptosis]
MKFATVLKSCAAAAAIVVAGASQAAPGGHAAVELISNGSFEQNLQASGTWDIYNNLIGWHGANKTGIELRNNVAGTALDGKNFVELDTTANSSMWQEVNDVAGKHYTLSFAFENRPGVASSSQGVQVFWGSQDLGVFNNASQWTTKTFDVIGNKGGTKLSFLAVGTSDSYGTSIDKVSLTSAVPEPETYGMLLAGLGLVAFVARRKAAK